MTIGALGAGRFVLLLLSALAVQATAGGACRCRCGTAAGAEPSERAEITVVAGAPCAPQLREVIADQLADLTAQLMWACRDRLDPEDLFRQAPPGGSLLRVWIDLRMARRHGSRWSARTGSWSGVIAARERPRRTGARTDRTDRQVCGAGRARR